MKQRIPQVEYAKSSSPISKCHETLQSNPKMLKCDEQEEHSTWVSVYHHEREIDTSNPKTIMPRAEM
jgi:hypothetical protein